MIGDNFRFRCIVRYPCDASIHTKVNLPRNWCQPNRANFKIGQQTFPFPGLGSRQNVPLSHHNRRGWLHQYLQYFVDERNLRRTPHAVLLRTKGLACLQFTHIDSLRNASSFLITVPLCSSWPRHWLRRCIRLYDCTTVRSNLPLCGSSYEHPYPLYWIFCRQ